MSFKRVLYILKARAFRIIAAVIIVKVAASFVFYKIKTYGTMFDEPNVRICFENLELSVPLRKRSYGRSMNA